MLTVLLILLPPLAASAQDDGVEAVRLRGLAEAVLAARYSDDVYRLDVRVKRVEATASVRAGLRLDFPAEDRLPRGTTQVKLFTGSDETGWQKAGWALLYVAHYDSVLVAGTTLRVGDEVTADDVSLAWMETTAFHGTLLRPSDWRALHASGAVFAARSTGEGRVLRHGTLRRAFAAETGAAVMMRFERSGLRLNLACKARQRGYVHDEIRLYSPDTGKTYRARLTGPGAATWIETL